MSRFLRALLLAGVAAGAAYLATRSLGDPPPQPAANPGEPNWDEIDPDDLSPMQLMKLMKELSTQLGDEM